MGKAINKSEEVIMSIAKLFIDSISESKDLKALAKKFIKDNPYPKDSDLHNFCDKQGISPHDFETAVYATLSDYIKQYG